MSKSFQLKQHDSGGREKVRSSAPSSLTWAAVDVETTGLSCVRDAVCEVAFVRDTESWSSLVRLSRDSRGRLGTKIHGLRHDQLRRAPTLANVLQDLHKRLSGVDIVVAHHAAFDLAFLGEAFRRHGFLPPGPSFLCTIRLTQTLFPHLQRYDLESVRRELGLQERPERHRALADARVVAELFGRMLTQHDGDVGRLLAAHGRPLTFRWSVSRQRSGS